MAEPGPLTDPPGSFEALCSAIAMLDVDEAAMLAQGLAEDWCRYDAARAIRMAIDKVDAQIENFRGEMP